MRDDDGLNLRIRLKNCLQTILELEPDLERLELGHVLMKEFNQLKSFMEKVREVPLSEEEVNRIERATESFLDELRAPMGLLAGEEAGDRLVQ